LSVAITAFMLSFFHRVAPAAIAQELIREFHTSAASPGLFAATYFYNFTTENIYDIAPALTSDLALVL